MRDITQLHELSEQPTYNISTFFIKIFNPLSIICGYTAQFVLDTVGNQKNRSLGGGGGVQTRLPYLVQDFL